MRVLVACEFSGAVRDAFARRGHDAWSCDLLPGDGQYTDRHIVADIRDVPMAYGDTWDMLIAFPPCTHLCASGARWFVAKARQQAEAVEFVRWLMDCPVQRIAIENPVGVLSTLIRPPDQIIQPWQFGHGETKATCLWLKGLQPLMHWACDHSDGREQRIHRMPPSADRGRLRSLTYAGIAEAMADQWGGNAR